MISRGNVLVTFLTLYFVAYIHCFDKKFDKEDAKKYLHKYGYEDSYSERAPLQANTLKIFQTWAHIPVSGLLDDATKEKMKESRCGMKDPRININTNSNTNIRVRRYLHQGTNWKPLFSKTGKMVLRWTLLNGARTLRYDTCQKVMRQAIHFWHQKTNIDFVEVEGYRKGDPDEPEILVSFENSGYHDDPFPFDGPGRTLAHAFYPLTNAGLSGDVHFDDAEEYTFESPKGRNLLWVATHELGHSLGLEHSQVREAVMYPWYTAYKPGFKLNHDDVLGIQSLYGGRSKPDPVLPGSKVTTTTTTTKTTTTTTTTTPAPKFDKGKCPKFNRITAIYYNEMFRHIFAFTEEDGNKQSILFLGFKDKILARPRYDYFPKIAVPGNIDAIFTTQYILKGGNYQIVFTSGNGIKPTYHVYKGFSRSTTGFHSIHSDDGPLGIRFPSWVSHIDAAFTWPGNGRTYFFAGDYYWRYNNAGKRFDSGYPKRILGNWPGLPKQIDAAYSSPDKKTTFFLSGNLYYLFDDANIRVKAVYPMKQFLQCDGAGMISDTLSLSAGSLSVKTPKKVP